MSEISLDIDAVKSILQSVAVDLKSLASRHGVDFKRDFASELEELARTIDPDFYALDDDTYLDYNEMLDSNDDGYVDSGEIPGRHASSGHIL